jgi:hypothetical protein
VLQIPHVDVGYYVTNSTMQVNPPSVIVSAPTDATDGNVDLPLMETETKLYYNDGSDWHEITDPTTCTWMSKNADGDHLESCMSALGANKSFQLHCTNTDNYYWDGTYQQTWSMKYTVSVKPVSGVPASPDVIEDTFSLTLRYWIRTCADDDILQQVTSTSNKVAYAGVTMTIPAIQYQHVDGLSSCAVNVVCQVSDDNSAWKDAGDAIYDDLINA